MLVTRTAKYTADTKGYAALWDGGPNYALPDANDISSWEYVDSIAHARELFTVRYENIQKYCHIPTPATFARHEHTRQLLIKHTNERMVETPCVEYGASMLLVPLHLFEYATDSYFASEAVEEYATHIVSVGNRGAVRVGRL